jgi:hypothetical protein
LQKRNVLRVEARLQFEHPKHLLQLVRHQRGDSAVGAISFARGETRVLRVDGNFFVLLFLLQCVLTLPAGGLST